MRFLCALFIEHELRPLSSEDCSARRWVSLGNEPCEDTVFIALYLAWQPTSPAEGWADSSR